MHPSEGSGLRKHTCANSREQPPPPSPAMAQLQKPGLDGDNRHGVSVRSQHTRHQHYTLTSHSLLRQQFHFTDGEAEAEKGELLLQAPMANS